ncbi:hypothetical protein [Sediminibacterium ginsengisoli]|uniref:hypothetical protein n=1 Tax=Sediminibacterium ginsengisoli TaxID=413434 RepID=UPI001C37BFC6|nr:hypothetical protein [Sediminibacterium ginsengisoli]
MTMQAQNKKVDTTMKIGKSGYKVYSNNRYAEKNDVSVSPIGFESEARGEFSFEIKGRLKSGEVDDLNNDGFPDLVLYVHNGDSLNKINVVGISSEKNQSVVPIVFPDIVDDMKLKEGYNGQDEFFLMEGSLVRRFPIYTPDSTSGRLVPSGKIRQVQYRVVPGDRGMLKFKVVRSYDYVKQ